MKFFRVVTANNIEISAPRLKDIAVMARGIKFVPIANRKLIAFTAAYMTGVMILLWTL
jgi:hypothetical protein